MSEQSLLENIKSAIAGKFSDAIISAEMQTDFPVFEIKKEHLFEVIKYLKEEPSLNFNFLTTLCGLHYPDNKGRELGVMYQLHNMYKNERIRIKVFVPVSDPVVPSVSSLYASANWQERQEYDFFGILFNNHPNLKRILNMDEMNYFPMRKEYALEDGQREDKDDKMFGR